MTNSSKTDRSDIPSLPPLQARLCALAESASGFAASEITGLSAVTVRQAAEALVAAGHIVSHRVAPRRIRYFATLAQAQAYSRHRTPATRVGVAGGPRVRATWHPDEPAIITSRTKITVAPRLPRSVYRTNTYLQF